MESLQQTFNHSKVTKTLKMESWQFSSFKNYCRHNCNIVDWEWMKSFSFVAFVCFRPCWDSLQSTLKLKQVRYSLQFWNQNHELANLVMRFHIERKIDIIFRPWRSNVNIDNRHTHTHIHTYLRAHFSQ